jgi:signal recognition particle subunit SRP54
MVPGMAGVKRQMNLEELDDKYFTRAEAIIYSMTPVERHNPNVINGSRRRRIASGSGTTTQEVNQLINQWRQAKKLMESMASQHNVFNMFRG